MLGSLAAHRRYIWTTALGDVRHRYVGSSMGLLWNVLQPLAQILIFTIVFARLMHRDAAAGAPSAAGTSPASGYVLLLCSALLPWNALADCLHRTTHAFPASAMYLRKLPIPEAVFIAQAAVSSLISLSISFGLLLVVALAIGQTPTWHWLLVPLPLVSLIAMGFGFGLALGTLFVFLRDIGQVLTIVLQLGFWAYPIVYDLRVLPEWFQRVVPWNPVYPFFESIRDLFLRGVVPGPEPWLAMLPWVIAANVNGALVLGRQRGEIRDVI